MLNKSSFGNIFRITTFGESHGSALGVVIDGCPAGFLLDLNAIEKELERRRPGQSKLVTPRKELDQFEILSGVFEGKTTGAPIMAVVYNNDVKSKDYESIKDLFRPGHADFTYFAKYGHRDYRGGGRSSARETIGRVIAGAIAKQLLATIDVSFRGGVIQVGSIKANNYQWDAVENNIVRSVDPGAVAAMTEEIESARKARDSVGGIVEVQALNVPVGLGEPIFAKLDALIAGALMSIPAVKGVEIGTGFGSASMRGSEMNDRMYPDGFSSNNHGGILGGLSSGAPIVARIVVKPTSSIPQDLDTIDSSFSPQKISTKGRHDPCVAIRAVPIAEAMLALVLVDCWLSDLASRGLRSHFSASTPIKYGLKD
jgi:chorismate synthase